MPGIKIEARLDSAFFSAEIVGMLDGAGVDFTLSVPFERFAELKTMIEGRRRWRRFKADLAFFTTPWKPKSWEARYRFLFIRERVVRQYKGPIQLDLFIPHQLGYDFKVIVTNKRARMKKVRG